jgi:CHASE3 domain sensor protein
MSDKLSPKEYKKLIIDIAKNINPTIILKEENSDAIAQKVASYSKNITDAVNVVLKGIEKKEK